MLIALQALGLPGAPLVQVDPTTRTVRAAGAVLGAWEAFEPQGPQPGPNPALMPNQFRAGWAIRFRAGGLYMGVPPPGSGLRVIARGPAGPFSLKKLSGSSSGVIVRDGDRVALVADGRHVRAAADGVLRLHSGGPGSNPFAVFRAIVNIGVVGVAITDGNGAPVSSFDFRGAAGTRTTLQVTVTTSAGFPVVTDAVLYTNEAGAQSTNVPLVAAAFSSGARRSDRATGTILPAIRIRVDDPFLLSGRSSTRSIRIFAALWPEEFYSAGFQEDAKERFPTRTFARLSLIPSA